MGYIKIPANVIKFLKLEAGNFKHHDDDGRFIITDKKGNEIIIAEAYPYYDLDDVLSEEEIDEIFSDDLTLKMEHLEVKDEYKGQGYAKELVKEGLKYAKKQGNEIYLNASPIGHSGLNLNDLTKFYKKFGFKVLYKQGPNNIMIKYF